MRRYHFLLLVCAETLSGEMGDRHLALLPQLGPCTSWEASYLTWFQCFKRQYAFLVQCGSQMQAS